VLSGSTAGARMSSFWHKLFITKVPKACLGGPVQNRVITAAECRGLAAHHRAQASEVGISRKRATVLANIAHSFAGLASQLEMLADDVAQKPGK